MSIKDNRRRYRLTLEYDGTNFSGWQKQADARTVQGDVLKGAARVFGKVPMDLQGCGRTDSGVHALEYIAHLEVVSDMGAHEVAKKLNETLPKDLAVKSVEAAGIRFHARHNCIARSYVYQIRTEKSAFGKRYDWWVQDELDIPAMQHAGSMMTGMHDFAAFAEKKELKKSTKVLVHKVEVFTENGILKIRVVGSHFLWHMVRRVVGVMVEVGCQRLTEDNIQNMLENNSDILPSHHTAPGAGLFFEKAFYDNEGLAEFLKD
ncbi:MAG: tRNA pseudouridine(38-40) synthase TruA [Desulfotalea sp.]